MCRFLSSLMEGTYYCWLYTYLSLINSSSAFSTSPHRYIHYRAVLHCCIRVNSIACRLARDTESDWHQQEGIDANKRMEISSYDCPEVGEFRDTTLNSTVATWSTPCVRCRRVSATRGRKETVHTIYALYGFPPSLIWRGSPISKRWNPLHASHYTCYIRVFPRSSS